MVAGLVLVGLLTSLYQSGPPAATGVNTLSGDVQSGWTNVTSTPSPPPMAGAMMAYSSKDHRFVLFGGWDGAKGMDGTWIYEPGNRAWRELHPTVSPIGRGDGMFVYDSRSDKFLLFGGWHEETNGTYTRLDDTWLFSFQNTTWKERHPARSPSARSDSEVAYDPLLDTVLLLGGFNGSAYLGDIWAYTMSDDTWSARPAAVKPSPRADGRLVYIESQDRFILFGGNDHNGPSHHLADTWTYSWNSNVWKLLSTKDGPGARDYPMFAFDPATRRALLTGGFGDGTILNDLWAFDIVIDTWFDLAPAISPPPRFAATGGFDPTENLLVLFSGLANTGLLADTWYYSSRPSSAAQDWLSPTALVGVGSLIVAGVAVGTLLVISRRRRSRGLP
jgi:hypothetical protein